jgi:purine-binding chemotaxis protein CheW
MSERQLATFPFDGQVYGIDVLLVREIIRHVEYTPVEHAPAGVLGLLNLRGQIITVLDLSSVLGLAPRQISPDSHCIILKTREELMRSAARDAVDDETPAEIVGILVDRIADVVALDSSCIDPPPANARGVHGTMLSGIAKIQDRLILILQMREALAKWSAPEGASYGALIER